MKTTELTFEQLRRICNPAQFDFKSTEELPVLKTVIGQERALRTITFGIDIDSYGYHIFALGPTVTDKTTTIRKFLEQKSEAKPTPMDWCYVNNFEDQDRPNAVEAHLRELAGKVQSFDKEKAYSKDGHREHAGRKQIEIL